MNDVAAPADSLAGSFTPAAPGFALSGFGPFTGLAAGDTHGGLMVQLNTSNAGTLAGQITLSPQSTNPIPFTLDLAPITINLTGIVHLAGDFNFDGVIDTADYIAWRKGMSPTPHSQFDYDIWYGRFGQTMGPGAGGAPESAALAPLSGNVPEPTTVATFAVLGIILIACQRRRLRR